MSHLGGGLSACALSSACLLLPRLSEGVLSSHKRVTLEKQNPLQSGKLARLAGRWGWGVGVGRGVLKWIRRDPPEALTTAPHSS